MVVGDKDCNGNLCNKSMIAECGQVLTLTISASIVQTHRRYILFENM